jgi:hypothetical protein
MCNAHESTWKGAKNHISRISREMRSFCIIIIITIIIIAGTAEAVNSRHGNVFVHRWHAVWCF